MRLEFQRKSLDFNLDGSLRGTIVTLGHMDGGHLPVVLTGDKTDFSNQELFDMAMEKHYEENFPQRAENEKFNLLGEKIAKYDELIEKSQKAIKELEGVTEKAIPTIAKMEEQLALADSSRTGFTSLVLLLYGKGTLTDEDLIETGLFEI